MGAEVPHDRARVHIRHHRDAIALQVLIGDLRGAPVRADGGELPDDEALYIRARGFCIRRRGAVVPDLGIGQNHDLSCIGRIREDLLVARQRRVEDDLAHPLHRCAKAPPSKHTPVFQGEHSLHDLSPLKAIAQVYQSLARNRVGQHKARPKPGFVDVRQS